MLHVECNNYVLLFLLKLLIENVLKAKKKTKYATVNSGDDFCSFPEGRGAILFGICAHLYLMIKLNIL